MATKRRGAWNSGCGVMLFLIALPAALGAGAAGEISVESGQWEMKSTTHNPMTGEPQTMTVTECVDGGSLNAGSFLQDSASCEVSDIQTSATSMRWKMTCAAPGGKMSGQAQVQSSASGKKVAGTMKMTASFGGQTMDFSSEWAGRWIGPCPE